MPSHEFDWKTRQQIAVVAALFGAINGVLFTLSDDRLNPLGGAVIGFLLCLALGWFSRWLGVLIIVLSVLMIIGQCAPASNP